MTALESVSSLNAAANEPVFTSIVSISRPQPAIDRFFDHVLAMDGGSACCPSSAIPPHVASYILSVAGVTKIVIAGDR